MSKKEIIPKLIRKSVTAFTGAAGAYSSDPEALAKSKNIFCDTYGARSYPSRRTLRTLQNTSGFASDGTLYWIENRRLYIGGYPVEGLYLSEGEKKILCLGGYVFILPDGIYVSLSDTSDFGNIHAELEFIGSSAVNCGEDLTPIESFSVIEKEPENASEGDYRAVLKNGEYVMLRYDGNNWRDAETYVRINVPGAESVFKKNDVVSIYRIDEKCEKSFIISHIIEDFVYFRGCDIKNTGEGVKLVRYFPKLDHAEICGGRLCGCRSSVDRYGNFVRKFYASAKGRPFDFISSDSICIDIVGRGELLGVAELESNAVVFSEDKISEITLSSSRLYCDECECEGLSTGAKKSIVCLENVLYYKGKTGIMKYSHGSSEAILKHKSMLFDDENDCPAIAYNGKIYVCAKHEGEAVIAVFDPVISSLSFADNPGISDFACRKNILYALVKGDNGDEIVILDYIGASAADKNYCSDGITRSESELAWELETGAFGFEDLLSIYPEFLTLRLAKCPINTKIELIADLDELGTEIATVSAAGIYTFPIKIGRCDTVKVRLSGSGEFLLRGLMLAYTSELETRSIK